MNTTITARTLFTDIGAIEFPVITVSGDGTFADISSDPGITSTDILTAAFFDIHTHGAIGYDVMTASPRELGELQRFMASHGVAHYLPSTVTDSVDNTLRALESLGRTIEAEPREGEAQPVGIHLEGPFISHAKRGMHPTAHLQPPSIELFDRFYQAARGHISLLTIAPEPNANLAPAETSIPPVSSSALDLIRHATGLGVRCSIGHTNATAEQTIAGIKAGAASATHTFNAMRPLDHREPGVLGTVLDDDHLFAELICDGVHVAPPLVRLWLKAKTASRGILVTDALSAAGMPEGEYTLGSTAVHVGNGRAVVAADLAAGKETLAGSIITMDQAVANLRRFTGAPLADAVRLAAHNPAAMLGRPQLTRLAPGSPANLNRFDAQGNLIATYIRGRVV